MAMIRNISSFILLIFFPIFCFSKNISHIPRFVSTKSDHVNARKGPGTSYPIEWVYVKIHEPLKVIQEFEEWRKVEDIDGISGWVHSSVISKRRYVTVTCDKICSLFKRKNENSSVKAEVEEGLRCHLEKTYGKWSKIKCQNYVGYLESSKLWGLLPGEVADE